MSLHWVAATRLRVCGSASSPSNSLATRSGTWAWLISAMRFSPLTLVTGMTPGTMGMPIPARRTFST